MATLIRTHLLVFGLVVCGGCEPRVIPDPIGAESAKQVQVVNTTKPAAPIDPSTAGTTKEPLRKPVELLKTAPLDIDGKAPLADISARFRKARADQTILPTGESELDRLYQLVCSRGFQGARDDQEVNQRLEQWVKDDPNDSTPLVALARLALAQAYRRRGDQYGNLVSKKREERFALLLANARDLAQQALERGANDPELYRILCETEMQMGSDPERVADWIKSGRRAGPRYFPLQATVAKGLIESPLVPPSALVAFANQLRSELGADDGLEAYVRVAFVASQHDRSRLLYSGFSYDHLRRGARVLHQRYPRSAEFIDFLAVVAYLTGDQELGVDLLPELNTRTPDLVHWGDQYRYTLFVKWCERKPPPDEADATFWPDERGGSALAFVDGDKHLVTSSVSPALRLWSVGQPELPPAAIPTNLRAEVGQLNADRTGSQLLYGCFRAYCFFFPLERDLLGRTSFRTYDPPPTNFALHDTVFEIAADSNLAVAFVPGQVDVFDPQQGTLIRQFEIPIELKRLPQFGRHLSPDGKWLALCGDGRYEVWDTTAGKKAYDVSDKQLKTHYLAGVISCLPDGHLILQTVEKTNQQAKVYLSRWDASEQKMTHYCEVDRRARHIASLEEKLVAMSTVTSNVYYPEVLVYDLQTGKLVRTLVGHNGATRDARFSNNGEWLATLEQTGPVRLWNLKRPETPPAAQADE
jgi:hypothetical protein